MTSDIRHAWRSIARAPLVSAVIILSLGAGIGANAVVFSWIQAVVLRPIPGVVDASSFYLVEPRTDGGVYTGTSWLEYGELRGRLTSVRDLFAFRMTPLYAGQPGAVERAYGLLVSGNYFQALGLRPALGRFIGPGDTVKAGGEPVAVISHDYWRTHFAGAGDVIGRSQRINGIDVTVIGVAPRGFLGTVLRLEFDIWLPATLAPALFAGSRELDSRGSRGYTVLARLAPGASRESAQGEVATAMRELEVAYPETNGGLTAEVMSFALPPRGPQRFLAMALSFLQGIMLLLLLTVCGTAANLMLARASARYREMGLRLALGSPRTRVARLFLVENLILAFAGALVGLVLAWWGARALAATPLTIGFPFNFDISLDATAVLFLAALAVLSALACGVAPAVQVARIDPQTALRSGASPDGRSLFRNALMAGQVGLAVVALVAAGLFLRSFLETRGTDPGFRREGVLLAAYDLAGRSGDEGSARRFAASLLAGMKRLPGVEGAAIATSIPLDIHGLPSRSFTVEGWVRSTPGAERALTNTVTPGYFGVMGIPILMGEDFADLLDGTAPPQAIVNEAFVHRYLPRLAPLGRQLQTRDRTFVIVGVVRTSMSDAFGEPPTPVIYLSYRDSPASAGEMHVRTSAGGEAALTPRLRALVRDLDPELPVYNVRTLTDHVENSLLFRRIPARMFAVLGPMLLVLAAMGIYAVVAYNISQRTTEVGVRLALGATSLRVIVQLVFESLAIVSLGVMAGWLMAFLLAPVVIGSEVDGAVFAGVPALLFIVAALACWLPARRVAALDPMVALRAE